MPRVSTQCQAGLFTQAGTLHRPPPGAEGSARLGLLLLNAGPAPRAGNSDLYAHMGDHLAERGMFCFRFDFPGLGDSTGPSWQDIRSYWFAAQRGGNDDAVTTLVETLCKRFDLRGLIVGGLCAGAICALRPCVRATPHVAGLLLLEPDFRAADAAARRAGPQGAGEAPTTSPNKRRKTARRFQSDELLSALGSKTRSSRIMSPLQPMLDKLLMRRLGHLLPPDVLVQLVMTWQKVLERGLPSLVVLADGLVADTYLDRVFRTFPPSITAALRCEKVVGTNHILTAGDARRQVIALVDDWVAETFPGAFRAAAIEADGPCGGGAACATLQGPG